MADPFDDELGAIFRRRRDYEDAKRDDARALELKRQAFDAAWNDCKSRTVKPVLAHACTKSNNEGTKAEISDNVDRGFLRLIIACPELDPGVAGLAAMNGLVPNKLKRGTAYLDFAPDRTVCRVHIRKQWGALREDEGWIGDLKPEEITAEVVQNQVISLVRQVIDPPEPGASAGVPVQD